MKVWIGIALAAQLLAGAASAQALHPLDPDGLSWKSRPNGNDIARYYPDRASRAGQPGWVVIECQTDVTGTLKACQILGEAPAGESFGSAGLALSKLFKIDTSKVAPETLAGGVVTIPIILTMSGAPLPQRGDLAGSPSALLTPSAKGTVPCPTTANPKQTCTQRRFAWSIQPTLAETAPFVRAAGATPATTAVLCPIGEDMKLSDCRLASAADPSQVQAMNGLIPLFAALPQANDKTPAKGGFALIQFDWPALKHAVETSVLTRAP